MAKLHGKATTTPVIRKAIQESKESLRKIAKKYQISYRTVIKWKKRDSTEDIKPGPKNPGSRVLTKTQEAMIVAFRKHAKLGLDDCLYVLKHYIPNLTRMTLYRCLQRHNIHQLSTLQNKQEKKPKPFKQYQPGYAHIDITQLYTKEGKLYLFVAIDRTTKYVYLRLYKDQTKKTSLIFLNKVISKMPVKPYKILTDNGLQFTHHAYKTKKEKHEFTQVCHQNKIEHRLTKPYHPWTNGQVERMNRTIKEATVKRFYYKDHNTLESHLMSFIKLYNYANPLKTLKGNTPYEQCLLYLNEINHKSKNNPMNLSAIPNT